MAHNILRIKEVAEGEIWVSALRHQLFMLCYTLPR